ncbi:hypothetical protein PIECOFPK_01469 [Mycovorax composti]|uniref:Outer membrane protein beta-barrel domain-containing protein n=1 Tax=Mycovorax composti TaxID=2962693 RepID=A0ABZ2EJU2_9BACT
MQLKQLLFGGLFFAAFSVAAVPSHAQAGRLGLNAGVNFATIAGKDAEDMKLRTGFQAGVTYDFNLGNYLVLQPGVLYVQNGATSKVGVIENMQLNYVQVPVTFQFQPTLGNGNLLLGVGPYIGLGVGKVKMGGTIGGVDWSTKYHWDDIFEEGEELRKFDAGGKLLVGYQLGMGLSFNLNFNRGLVKLNPNSESKFYNTAFGLTVGYKF